MTDACPEQRRRDTERFTLFHRKTDIAQSPQFFAIAVAVIFLADAETCADGSSLARRIEGMNAAREEEEDFSESVLSQPQYPNLSIPGQP